MNNNSTLRYQEVGLLKRLFLVISLFQCISTSTEAQELKTLLAEMRKNFEKSNTLEVQMRIRVYDDGNTNPSMDQRAYVKRDDFNYAYTFGANEMLMNEKYIIMVDNSQRQIIYTPRDVKDEEKMFDVPYKIDIDSILSFYGKPEQLEKQNDIVHYRVEQKKGAVRQVDLFIDLLKGHLSKMSYTYKEGQIVNIDFEIFDINPKFQKDVFSESRYFYFIKGKVEGATAFSSYKIVKTNTEN